MGDSSNQNEFYQKYRVQIWSTIFALIGAIGGNSDRLDELLPKGNKSCSECSCNDTLDDLDTRTKVNAVSIDGVNRELNKLNYEVGEALKGLKND